MCAQTVALLQSENIADFLDPDIRDLAYPRVQGRHLASVLVKLIKYLNAHVPLLGAPPDPRRKAQMVRRRRPDLLLCWQHAHGRSAQEEVLKAISRV